MDFKLKGVVLKLYSALVDNEPSLYLLLILPIFQHQSNAALLAKASPALGFSLAGDGHMTPEEVERHLQSRQSYLELLPERAPPTVPTEMFSNDPSLDRYAKTNVEDLRSYFSIYNVSASNDIWHLCKKYFSNISQFEEHTTEINRIFGFSGLFLYILLETS